MKKILFTTLCAALLMSCASKRAGMVDFTITEAKTLQKSAKDLAQAQGTAAPALADSLITEAEKQNGERQTEAAFVLADQAVLQLQLFILKQECAVLDAENKKVANSLSASREALDGYRNMLNKHKNAPKEQISK